MPGLRRLPSWLQTISGHSSVLAAPPVVERSESVDAIVRDLHDMQDEESRSARLSLSKHDRKGSRRSSRHGAARVQHRPAPKAVVHKEPTRAKKRKEKVKSNRSGSKGKGFMA